MADEGDFWNDVKNASRRHKTMVADKRDAAAARQFEAANAIATAHGMKVVIHPKTQTDFRLICNEATFNIHPSHRRIVQIEGKGMTLPLYFKATTDRGWLVDAVEQLIEVVHKNAKG